MHKACGFQKVFISKCIWCDFYSDCAIVNWEPLKYCFVVTTLL